MGILFSICICTRNRSGLLDQALQAARRQTFSAECFEVVVVDNASSDGTAPLLREVVAQDGRMRAFFEPEIGFSAARNHAAREAAGEWLAYLDDDALPPANWLETAAQVIQSQSPDLLGGPFYPFYTSSKPGWFLDSYGEGRHGVEARWLQSDEYLFGGNFIIQKSLLLQAGGFPADLRQPGGILLMGEETRLQRALRRSRPPVRIYYSPQLAVRHWVSPEKMRLRRRMRQRWLEGRTGYLVFRSPSDRLRLVHLLGFIGMPIVLLWLSSIGMIFRSRERFPAWQNYIFEVVLSKVAVWGKLYQRLVSAWRGDGYDV